MSYQVPRDDVSMKTRERERARALDEQEGSEHLKTFVEDEND